MPMNLSYSECLITAFALLSGQKVDAFANGQLSLRSRFVRERHNTMETKSTKTTSWPSLKMALGGFPLVAFFAAESGHPGLLLAASASAPIVEAEIFSDAAHVALDMAAFLGADSLTIRIVSVIGRLCSIASDIVPDHSMLPEEFLFQGIMLWVAVAGLVKVLAPIVSVQKNTELTIRDQKCFVSLFRPAGVDCMQYKLLRALAMEWKELGPGDVITTDGYNSLSSSDQEGDDNLYWLYSKDIFMKRQVGEIPLAVSPRKCHLLGNFEIFAAATTSTSSKKGSPASDKSTTTTYYAGERGAIVLSINKRKMKELMDMDASLDRAIRDILFESMQVHVSSLLLLGSA